MKRRRIKKELKKDLEMYDALLPKESEERKMYNQEIERLSSPKKKFQHR